MSSDLKWTDVVECPKCHNKMQLKTLKYHHICGSRPGRPRVYGTAEMDNWTSSVAALEGRLAARNSRARHIERSVDPDLSSSPETINQTVAVLQNTKIMEMQGEKH